MVKRISRFVWIILVMFLVAGAAYYLFIIRTSRYEARQFAGDVVGIENDKIILLKGVFLGKSDKIPANRLGEQKFSFRVDQATVFIKSEVQWPTSEELKATDGRFNLEDLARKDSSGSLDDLRSSLNTGGVFINADFPVSILDSINPVASKVVYRLFVPAISWPDKL